MYILTLLIAAELDPYSRYSIGELELSGWQKMAGMTGSRQALEVNGGLVCGRGGGAAAHYRYQVTHYCFGRQNGSRADAGPT